MTGEFGRFIAAKRLEKDVKLKPIAERLGMSVTYLSDIIKGRRNPPDKEGLEILAEMFDLNEEEKDMMFDLAGRERDQVSPDLTDYIMDESLPSARAAYRKARNANLGDDFWKSIVEMIDNRGDN